MKKLLSYVAIAALIIASSFTVNQQQQLNQQQSTSGCFVRFDAHRAGKSSVELTWSVSSPDIVQFEVERSYDGDFYDNVTTMDFNGSSSYKSKDAGVYPGVIYYRITAVKSDGTTECSSVETVRIVQHG